MSVVEGEVAEVLWTGMGDYAEVEVVFNDGSGRTRLTREGDSRLYVPRQAIRVCRVLHPWKKPNMVIGQVSAITTLVELGPEAARSAWVAPGPGGLGYRLASDRGPVLHFFTAGSAEAAKAAVGALEKRWPVVTSTPVVGTNRILIFVHDDDQDLSPSRIESLRGATVGTAASYDGSELIGVMSVGPTGVVTAIAPPS